MDNEEGLTELSTTDNNYLSSDAQHFKAVQDESNGDESEGHLDKQEQENASPEENHQRPQRNRVATDRLGSMYRAIDGTAQQLLSLTLKN